MRRFTAILTAVTLSAVAAVHLLATERPTEPLRVHAAPALHVPTHPGARFRRLAPLRDMPLSSANDVDLDDAAEVIGVAIKGQARAYVLAALEFPDHVYHDELSGKHFSVTYCDRTGCARVFQRNKGDELEVGGWSGTGMMLIVDGEYWQQDLPGFPLRDLDFTRTTWAQWRQEHPSSKVYVGQHRSRTDSDVENPCPDPEVPLPTSPTGPPHFSKRRGPGKTEYLGPGR